MKYEDAIGTIQDMLDVMDATGSCYVYKHNGGDIRLKNVLECLRAQQELTSNLKVLESNDPLTLDELRKMNGEPVWFKTDYEEDRGWHICHGEYKGRYIACDGGSCYDFGFFLGGHIVAYRHPPKEMIESA